MEMQAYLGLFLAEAREHLRAADAAARELERNPGDHARWRELRRHAHSLKGMAAAMGFRSIVRLAHRLEDRLQEIQEAPAAAREQELAALVASFARLERLVRRVETGDVRPDPSREAAAADAAAPSEPSVPGVWRVDLDLDPAAGAGAGDAVAAVAAVGALAELRRAAPPLPSTATGGFDGRLRLVVSSERPAEDLRERLARLHGVRRVELTAVEDREPAAAPASERVRWVRVRAAQLDALQEDLLELRLAHRRLAAALEGPSRSLRRHLEKSSALLRSVHATVTELRLVPFESVNARLERVVGDLQVELGKQVEFRIEGEQVRLDRSVLDALLDPLLHVVRNALDHGIEPPGERVRCGKPACGSLRIHLTRHGDRFELAVEDDGRGMLADRLRRAAVERGVIDAPEAERLSDEQALMLTTLPGFSTAARVSHVSGRGLGLDVVRDSLTQLGGRLEIRSNPGRGTRVAMFAPLSVVMLQALLLRCARQTYALPIDAVRRTSPATSSADPVPHGLRLDHCLGARPRTAPPPADSWAVRVEAEERCTTLIVDGLDGIADVLVRPLGPPLGALRAYTGAALLADGTIALMLDPAAFVAAEAD